MTFRLSLAAAGAAVLFLFPLARAGVATAPGWSNAVAPLPSAGFLGGFDVLPDGNAILFDGTSIVAVDATSGAVLQTLHTPASFVFGSFLRVAPGGTYALFGESSNGTITRVPLDGSPASLVATIPFNFACAFQSAGVAFVSHGDTTFANTQVTRLDVRTGATDPIAGLPGPSGPLAFDRNGSLYVAENSPVFPAPIGLQTIWLFDASVVASAVGPGSVTLAQAIPAVTGVTAPFDLVLDEEGDLFVADAIAGTIEEWGTNGLLKSEVGAEAPGNGVTYLAFRGNGAAAKSIMGPFQPPSGGALYAISSDFVSFNELNLVTPRRADLDSVPPSPIPPGPFTVDLTRGPPFGTALVFLSAGSVNPEVRVASGGVPFFFAIDFATFLGVFPVPLDFNGAIALGANNPGGPATATLQAALIGSDGQLLGTTHPLTLVTQ